MPYIGQAPTSVAFLTDTFSGNGSTTAFTMSVAPANTASVLVAVSGVLQDPSTYSVVGTTLTFTGAPPTGTGNISARYLGIPASGVTTTAYRTLTTFTATANQTTFTPPSYTPGFINVYRNGVLLTPTTDYTATNGTTVVLLSGATSGDTVIVESFYVSSVLNAIPNTAASISTSNLTDGSITQAKLSTNVAGNGPAFSAYRTGTQGSFASATYTKVQLNTKLFDTASAFDNTTNYRFQPTVAGYYQVNYSVVATGTALSYLQACVYKFGSIYAQGNYVTTASGEGASSGACLMYLNGSTDYLELYAYASCTGTFTVYGGANPAIQTFLSASLVRSA